MATFNGARFVLEQLESIRTQSVPPDAVYIADDGSTDGTVELVQEWIARHHLEGRWRIRVNPENLGYAENFMRLIAEAVREGADYIFLADQDDIWLPGKAERMLSLMSRFPAMGLLCSDLEPFYTDPGALPYGLAGLKWGKKPFLRFSAQWIWALRPGCSYLLAAGFAGEAVQYWEQWGMNGVGIVHDTFLWALAHLKDVIAYDPHVTMRYRRHGSNGSGMVTMLEKEQRVHLLEQTILWMELFLKEFGTMPSGFPERQVRFFKRRLSYLSRGRSALPALFADGLLHLDCYIRKRHFLSDLYVCPRRR